MYVIDTISGYNSSMYKPGYCGQWINIWQDISDTLLDVGGAAQKMCLKLNPCLHIQTDHNNSQDNLKGA